MIENAPSRICFLKASFDLLRYQVYQSSQAVQGRHAASLCAELPPLEVLELLAVPELLALKPKQRHMAGFINGS
jgi:hypothetical protein